MKNKKIIKLLISISILLCFIYVWVYPFIFKESLIKDFYADKARPAHSWVSFEYVQSNGPYTIVTTSYNPLKPKFTVLYRHYVGRTDNKDYFSADVIEFTRAGIFNVKGANLYQGYIKGKNLEDAVKFTKENDISTLPESEDYYVYKNPTKEEWMAKIEEKKLKLINSISNPSKTDSVDFSVSGDHEKNEILIKSLGKDMRNFGITFNDYQRMLDKEDYTYWVNDDEFILLINNFNGKDKIFPTFDLIKDYKDGIYTFNTKTKEFKMFIPITEPDRNFRVDYELTKDKIIIFTSNKTYTYDKQGKLIEVEINKK